MARIKVNPSAEVRSFAPVKAGTYLMKIIKHEEKTSEKGNQYIKWQLQFVDAPDRLLGIDGQALKGAPGSVFFNTMLNPDQQWNLRAIVEGALGQWCDFEPNELYGKEITCVISEDEYQGEISNKCSRVVLQK
jgi:hypothetical protein